MSDTKYNPEGCICIVEGVRGDKYLLACKEGKYSGKGEVLCLEVYSHFWQRHLS